MHVFKSDFPGVSPNTGATNSSGFTALPGGRRNNGSNNPYTHLSYYGYWWTATPYTNSSTSAYARYLYFESKGATIYGQQKEDAFSVKCIKD